MRMLAACLFSAVAACSAGSERAKAQLDPDTTGILLVGNKGEDSVSFIDLGTGRETFRRSTTGPAPHEIAISPDGKHAAVVHYGGSSMDIFKISDAKKVHTVDLSPNSRPHGIVWKGDRIYVTTEGADTLTIAINCDDAGQTTTADCSGWVFSNFSISTGQKGSHMVVVSPDADRAYVSNLQSRTVTVIDLLKRKRIVDLQSAEEPEGIDLTRDGKELWVASRGSDMVHVFDTDSLNEIATIDVGSFPIRLAISPDGKYAVTSDLGDGGLSVIDIATREVVRKIKVSGSADSRQVTILFNDDGSRIYVAETGPDTVAEVDFVSGKVLRRFNAGSDGDGLALAPLAK